MFSLFTVIGLSVFYSTTKAAFCHGKPDPNAQPNEWPILDANPTFLKSVENGQLYTVGPDNQQFYLLHIYGTPYEMGYAHGALVKDLVIEFVDRVWEYVENQVPLDQIIPGLVNMTVEEALQIQADLTKPYTPDYWFQEMQGLSDATGVALDDIYRIHMLPELTKGSCSMFGAWGTATPDEKLVQLRALDWDTDGPFKDYSAIIVYHPAEGDGNAFANIAMTGFIGSITGLSEKRVSISEIGVSYPDSTFGAESRIGYPFVFVLRDIIQYDTSVDDATQRLNDTHRTCDLILGAGCGTQNKFRGYAYSYDTLNVYDDTNLEPYNQTWHPRIQNVVYWGMDWLCPGYSQVLGEHLIANHGNITAYNAAHSIVAQTQTGDLHIAIYDYSNDQLLVSFHAKSDEDTIYQNAYDRQYIRFNMSALFA